ncbi:MAG: glycosyltransferase [Nitrospirae bacterium]|nr:glycosyltransferase [Nitrospirota bacterium]
MEIFYIFAGLTLLGLIAYGLQIWAVRSTLKEDKKLRGWEDENSSASHPLNFSTSQLPPVSILKPLKGLDDNLFDNLASFCTQEYPEYEIIFSLQDHNDPAYKVVRKIKDKYPDKDINIIVERCNDGLNPKVNNLIPAYKASKYELILISDSNVMVGKNYLKDTVTYMEEDPGVGLVSNMIRGVGGRTIGSVLENLHLNSFITGSVCFLDKFLKMPCVVGKSMLMKKGDLEAIGGFRSVKDVLAEDYIIGKKIHKRGKKVILSNHMINNVNEYWSIKKFLNRHIRWGKLRWKIGGFKYISELISNPVFISCLPIFMWEASRITISFALLVSFIKVLGDYYIGKKIGSRVRGQGSTDRGKEKNLDPKPLTLDPLYYLLSPVKDIIIGLIWFVPLFSNTVVWRGNRYIIGRDSILSLYPETGLWSWRYRLADAIKARLV